jgi:hypothetical protein
VLNRLVIKNKKQFWWNLPFIVKSN